MKVIFTSNNKKTFYNYRKDLLFKVSERCISKYEKLIIVLIKSVFYSFKKDLIVSSDGQCNFLLSLCPWLNRIIIVNGLGRFQNNKFIRSLFFIGITFNKNNTIILQNYRDYRYARLYWNHSDINWVPGSGGIDRGRGQTKGILFFTRDSKIKFFWPQIYEVLNYIHELRIVGLKDIKPNDLRLKNLGLIRQDDIFLNGNCLLQLYAYGDGVPHTLVDGICSNLDIIISKKSWVNFGFYRLTQMNCVEKHEHLDTFYHLRCGSEALIILAASLNQKNINEKYYTHIIRG